MTPEGHNKTTAYSTGRMFKGPTNTEPRFSDIIDRSEDTNGVVAAVEAKESLIKTEDSDW